MRIRTIKPEFFKHDVLGAMSPLNRLLFIGLWCMADCAGRLEDRPKRIKVEVLPYDDIDIDAALSELQSGGFITRYDVDGQSLMEILSFARNQRITGKEAESQSRFPGNHKKKPGKQRGNNGETTETTGRETEGKGNGRETEGGEFVTEKDFIAAWNALPEPFPPIRSMTEKRRASLRERGSDPFWLENWVEALQRIKASHFCRGQNDRKWVADVDFFLRPDSVAKTIEGKYDDRPEAGDNGERWVPGEPEDYVSVMRAQKAALQAQEGQPWQV